MKRKLIYISLSFILICIVSILVSDRLIKKNATQKLYSNISEIPHNTVGLLLGTAPKLKNGNNNLYFDYRIEATANLFKAQKIDYILISGDNRRDDYNEPEEMKQALIRKGIPEQAIYLDYAGLRTLDSVVRAKLVFGQSKFTVISQKFHNERAIYLAERNDIEAIGFNARDVNAYAGFKTQLRELFARVKMFTDLATGKKPRFLGEHVLIGKPGK